MSQTHFSTGDRSKLTTGWEGPRLRGLKWADVQDATGVRRAAIFMDLDASDVRAEIRLNPDAARRMKKSGIEVHVDHNVGPVVLTPEWQGLRASLAMAIWSRRREDATLGGEYYVEKEIPDGYGGKTWIPDRRDGEPNLIEVRLPGDTALALAAS